MCHGICKFWLVSLGLSLVTTSCVGQDGGYVQGYQPSSETPLHKIQNLQNLLNNYHGYNGNQQNIVRKRDYDSNDGYVGGNVGEESGNKQWRETANGYGYGTNSNSEDGNNYMHADGSYHGSESGLNSHYSPGYNYGGNSQQDSYQQQLNNPSSYGQSGVDGNSAEDNYGTGSEHSGRYSPNYSANESYGDNCEEELCKPYIINPSAYDQSRGHSAEGNNYGTESEHSGNYAENYQEGSYKPQLINPSAYGHTGSEDRHSSVGGEPSYAPQHRASDSFAENCEEDAYKPHLINPYVNEHSGVKGSHSSAEGGNYRTGYHPSSGYSPGYASSSDNSYKDSQEDKPQIIGQSGFDRGSRGDKHNVHHPAINQAFTLANCDPNLYLDQASTEQYHQNRHVAKHAAGPYEGKICPGQNYSPLHQRGFGPKTGPSGPCTGRLNNCNPYCGPFNNPVPNIHGYSGELGWDKITSNQKNINDAYYRGASVAKLPNRVVETETESRNHVKPKNSKLFVESAQSRLDQTVDDEEESIGEFKGRILKSPSGMSLSVDHLSLPGFEI